MTFILGAHVFPVSSFILFLRKQSCTYLILCFHFSKFHSEEVMEIMLVSETNACEFDFHLVF